MSRERPDKGSSFLAAISDDEVDGELRTRLLGPGKLVAGRYALRDRIGRGGMATIWEASDTKLGRVVAIKFMSADYARDADYRRRFEQEAKAATRLVTPFVVETYEHGDSDGVPFIVMERLYGEDLHARLERVTRLSLGAAGKIASEAGIALDVAHEAGIIHRDLKPKNLFLAEDRQLEIVKLLDFGVAKQTGTPGVTTTTGVMLGSPYYMSPEQIRCERDLDRRADLWSFAAILYRAVTGVKAFDGDLATLTHKITLGRARAPSKILPELPRSIDAFFEKAFAIERDARFQSARELVEAFLGR